MFIDDFNTMSPKKGYASSSYIQEIKKKEEREERRNIDFLVSEKFRIEARIAEYSKYSDVRSKVAVINFNKALKTIENEIKRRFSEDDFNKAVIRFSQKKKGIDVFTLSSHEGR